jgi:hypothetical protein
LFLPVDGAALSAGLSPLEASGEFVEEEVCIPSGGEACSLRLAKRETGHAKAKLPQETQTQQRTSGTPVTASAT